MVEKNEKRTSERPEIPVSQVRRLRSFWGSIQIDIKSSPNKLIDRTFRMVFQLLCLKKEPKPLKPKATRLYRNPIFVAQEWERVLGNGDCSSLADLARKLKVSRARVTQVLRILRLTPEVLNALVALGDPLPTPIVTERRLRPIVNLPAEEQRRKVNVILSGSCSQEL